MRSDKELSESYLHLGFFLHFGTPHLSGPALGVYNSLLLRIKYVKRSLLTQLTPTFDFQFTALALKLKLLFQKVLLSEKDQGDCVSKRLENYL